MNESPSRWLRNLWLGVTIGLILSGCSERSAPTESSSQAGDIITWFHQYRVEGE